VRDDACKADTWAEEYVCIMKSNSLRTVMDCVEIEERPGPDFEKFMCRPIDDGIANDAEQYYYRNSKKSDEWCTKPRTILMRGPLAYKSGKKLSINGALEACPENDPDFHNCLCMQNVQIAAMNALQEGQEPGSGMPEATEKVDPKEHVILERNSRDTTHVPGKGQCH
jgi:hypothetical protein